MQLILMQPPRFTQHASYALFCPAQNLMFQQDDVTHPEYKSTRVQERQVFVPLILSYDRFWCL